MGTSSKVKWPIYIVLFGLACAYAVWNLQQNRIIGHWESTFGPGLKEVRVILPLGDTIVAGGSLETDMIGVSTFSRGKWEASTTKVNRKNTVIDMVEMGTDLWALIFASENDPGGIFVSHDTGKTWEAGPALPEKTDPRCIIKCGKQKTRILIGTVNDGILRSDDQGKTWTRIEDGLDNPKVQCLWCDPFEPDTIFAGTLTGISRSSDAGETWNSLTAKNPGLKGMFVDIEGSPVTRGLILAVMREPSAQCHLMRSEDGGKTWNDSWNGLHPAAQVRCIAFNPDKPGELYIGTVYDGIFVSRNDGIYYQAMNTGFPPPDAGVIVHALKYVSTPQPILYAGTDKGGIVYTYNFTD